MTNKGCNQVVLALPFFLGIKAGLNKKEMGWQWSCANDKRWRQDNEGFDSPKRKFSEQQAQEEEEVLP